MPQLDNALLNRATTQTWSHAGDDRKVSTELPAPSPPAEASAFVASVLSGANQGGASNQAAVSGVGKEVAESVSSPVVARLFPPGNTGPAPSTRPPVASPTEQIKSADQPPKRDARLVGGSPIAPRRASSPSTPSAPRRARASAQLPYSNATVTLIVVALAVLLFGAGLAVGYRVSQRHLKGDAKSNVSGSTPDATGPRGGGVVALPKPADTQAIVLDAAESPQPNPMADLSSARTPALTQKPDQGEVKALSSNDINRNDSDHDFSQLAAQAGSDRRKGSEAVTTPRQDSASVPDKNFAPAKPGANQHLAIPPQPMGIAQAPLTETDGAKHDNNEGVGTAVASAQAVHPEQAANESVHPQTVLRLIETPAIPRRIATETTTEPPAVDSAGSEANVLPTEQPENLLRPTDASPGQIVPSQLVHSVQPIYPQEAKKRRIEGDVQLRVVVAADGTVRSVNVVSGPPLLQQAAIYAAREFRYKPASLGGQPIETVQTIEMSFTLKN